MASKIQDRVCSLSSISLRTTDYGQTNCVICLRSFYAPEDKVRHALGSASHE